MFIIYKVMCLLPLLDRHLSIKWATRKYVVASTDGALLKVSRITLHSSLSYLSS